MKLSSINWQIKVSVVLVVAITILFGQNAGLSVLIGMMSVASGMLIGSRIANKTSKSKEPFGIVMNMLKAEAVKIIVVITVLWVTFKFYKALVPLALIFGLGIAAILSGASIAKLNKSDK